MPKIESTLPALEAVPRPREGGDGARIFEGLNPEQHRAVEAVRGPVVILAGAGSGKTTTITRRIAHQIATGEFEPKNILAVTFTTKAASELVQRLARLGAHGAPAKTFHAAALSQLQVLGQVEIDVLPAKTALLWQIRATLPADYRQHHLGELASEIELAKNRRVRPDQYLESLTGRIPPIPAELMQRVYSEYESRKRASRKVDFEDLLELAIQMYETDSKALARFQDRYRAITVDEYQDVNLLQQSLLEHWVRDRDDLCVVGDDYQAIFGFTGASPKHLLEMTRRYEHATVIRLETNYRSTPQVLEWANRLALKLGGIPKKLVAANGEGPEPRLSQYSNEEAELSGVLIQIKELIGKGVLPKEIAVLYRANARSAAFEHAFHRERIPFQVAGGGFTERPAWKGVRKRLARSPESTELKRVVDDALDDAGFVQDILETEVSPQEFTRQQDLGLTGELAASFRGTSASDFVVWVESQFISYRDGETRDAVRLSTYHLAKGLEWESVFLVGLVEGEVPHWRSKREDEIAEERRLLYVGLTRAKRVLELSTNGVRFPSRFLAEAAPSVSPILARNGARAGSGSSKQEKPSSKQDKSRSGPRLSPKSWLPW